MDIDTSVSPATGESQFQTENRGEIHDWGGGGEIHGGGGGGGGVTLTEGRGIKFNSIVIVIVMTKISPSEIFAISTFSGNKSVIIEICISLICENQTMDHKDVIPNNETVLNRKEISIMFLIHN